MNRPYVPEIEFSNPAAIKSFQEAKLRETIAYLLQNSKFYLELFSKMGLQASDIKSLEDLMKIPCTEKNDLYTRNDDFVCVKRDKIRDYVTTSGTLGDPVLFALTDSDLERLAYNEALSFACAGFTEGDVYQLTTTIDRRFMAGMAYFLGARKIGAGMVRVGPGIPELQWDSIKRIKPTVLIAVPSFLLKMIEYAEKEGIDVNESGIKKAICIGEPIRNVDFTLNTLGQRIIEKWKIELFSTYASTEMGTAYTECEAGKGGHEHSELIITEILDENEIPVVPGMPGEVTITTLGTEAMPLLRFKTGDIARAHTQKCVCGRTNLRLGPVEGRKQQMIKYRGTTLYPPAIFDLLNGIPEISNYLVEVSSNDLGTDEINISVSSQITDEDFEKMLKDKFRARLRVTPRLHFDTEENIHARKNPPTARKPLVLIDIRS